jgi:exosortase family protein XrtF
MFLLRFFGVYIVLILLYNSYLAQFNNELDQLTKLVTEQVAALLSITLPEVTCVYSEVNPMAEIQYFGVPLVLLIEGCNAVSVMILFVSFLVAFKGRFKDLIWFAPLGIILLYGANLFRIYLIGMIILYFPNLTNMAHDYIFPGVIYGTSFLLWVIWVKYFANKN